MSSVLKHSAVYARHTLAALLVLCSAGHVQARSSTEIIAGPMLSAGNHHDVTLWARTSQPTTLKILFWPMNDPTAVREVSVKTGGEDDRFAVTTLSGLTAGTTFRYDFYEGERKLSEPAQHQFTTQPLWRRRAPPPHFQVAVGSCAYTGDPETDPPGKSYGGGYEIYESIHAQRPDLMLWLGDNVYFRPHDWSSRVGLFTRYDRSRRLASLQPLLASAYHYAIWDDHDFGPNDSNRSFVLKHHALDAFKAYWPAPAYGLPDQPGVFTQFSWGDVDFFLTDNRYYRAASNAPAGPDKTMLGERQFRWLLDALSASKAPFKIVAGGGQFLSPFDRWEGYAQFKHEQKRLIDEIKRYQIEGVVFVSGDRHHSELVRLQPSGFYPLYDFTNSPLTSRGASANGEWESPVRVPGTLVTQKRNFGLLKFSGPARDRVLTIETRDTDGRLLWTKTIRANELKIPKVR